jgi:methyl-accepting chemotaxis protein
LLTTWLRGTLAQKIAIPVLAAVPVCLALELWLGVGSRMAQASPGTLRFAWILASVLLVAGLVLASSMRRLRSDIEALSRVLRDPGDQTARLQLARPNSGELREVLDGFLAASERSQQLGVEIASSTAQFASSTALLGPAAESLHQDSAQLGEHAREFGSTAAAVSEAINEVADAVERSDRSIEEVSRGATTVSNSMQTAAGAAADLDRSITSVSAAIEQMSASLIEVSHGCTHSTRVAKEAAGLAEAAKRSIEDLGEAARDIGEVVSVINDIADQTKLLALNATIEAASAGDAGRGFAVVANEVKELARQTATATEQIRGRIGGVQHSTTQAVGSIRRISATSGLLHEGAESIAVSLEEQTATCADIAQNVGVAADMAEGINRAIDAAADATADVARGTTELARHSRESALKAADAAGRAEHLRELALSLDSAAVQGNARATQVKEAARQIAEASRALADRVSARGEADA